jgi:hypothetical protein
MYFKEYAYRSFVVSSIDCNIWVHSVLSLEYPVNSLAPLFKYVSQTCSIELINLLITLANDSYMKEGMRASVEAILLVRFYSSIS